MKSEFVPYELVLRLNSLGFDEPCLAFWDGKNTDAFYFNNIRDASGDYTPFQKHDRLKWFGAPLYQQAFRWFREKYELHSCIHSDYTWNISGGIWDLNEYKGSRYDWDYSNNYLTYEEAELSSLEKLIEIVESHT